MPYARNVRTLIYLEPVVFRNAPCMLRYHVDWMSRIARANPELAPFAFASSPDLVELMQNATVDTSLVFRKVRGASLTEPWKGDRAAYSRALFARAPKPEQVTPLQDLFRELDHDFCPELVLSSSQNAYLDAQFWDRRKFFFEQAPLPRARKVWNMCADPGGSHLASVLRTRSNDIRALPLSECDIRLLAMQWDQVKMAPALTEQQAKVTEWTTELRKRSRKVALFITQPADWVTLEGSAEASTPKHIIERWCERLPEDWIAVPTLHPDGGLSHSALTDIAKRTPNLALPPKELSSGLSELFLSCTDAVVTVSSTTSITAVLHGVPAIASPLCAFSGFCGNDIATLNEVRPLPLKERMALFAFLTHRYSFEAGEMLDSPGLVSRLFDLQASSEKRDDYLFAASPDLEKLSRLF